jgi:hypothetical protein
MLFDNRVRYFVVALLVILSMSGASKAEPYCFEKSDDIFNVQINIDNVSVPDLPLQQFRLERVELNAKQVQILLSEQGFGNVQVTQPKFIASCLLAKMDEKSNVLMDIDANMAPAYVTSNDPSLKQQQASIAQLLDSLSWPHMGTALTCMSVSDLANYYQERFGPGIYQEINVILQTSFNTSTAKGKSFVSFQSELGGYPLVRGISQNAAAPIDGKDTLGTVASFLLGEDNRLLYAYLPYPFQIAAQREMQSNIVDWRNAIPEIMDRQIGFYRYFIKENREFFPEIEAFWAQNKTTVNLGVKRVEAAYRVGADLMAVPVWQVCVEADFVYSGDDPIQVVRFAIPDIEETMFYIDMLTGQITQ